MKHYKRWYYETNKTKILRYEKKYREREDVMERRKHYQDKYRNLPSHRERTKELALVRKYGISSEQYREILLKQGNKCAVCKLKQPEHSKRFAVDHDHKSNKVRGLLCMNCNRAIGLMKDSPEILKSAINYLKVVSPLR